MKTYIDCGSGVAGDMLLGAFIGLGLSVRELERTLQRTFRLKDWRLVVQSTERQGWPAWLVRVDGDRPFGSAHQMIKVVRGSAFPRPVKEKAIDIFNLLEWAEERAHFRTPPPLMGENGDGGESKTPPTSILPRKGGGGAFASDGLGLLDTLVDVVGCAWGFWKMGLQKVTASPVNTGRMAPATAWMVQKAKIPIYAERTEHELATPTGVSILASFVDDYSPLPSMHLEKAGYGAGAHDRPGRPNVLVIYQGFPTTVVQGLSQEPVLLLETVIDDMDPRLYPHVSELLFKKGALDVWWAPIGMKKGRPGIAFSVLCSPESEQKLLSVLFRETTTLGVRRLPQQRWVLPRESVGRRKVAQLPDGGHKEQVEFEIAKITARKSAVPLRKLLK